MIVVSTTQYDPDCPVVFREAATSKLGDVSRRTSRIATLDGGAVLADYGYTDADRTLKVSALLTVLQIDLLETLISRWGEHTLSCNRGFFVGVINELTFSRGETTFTFLVTERLA